MASSEPLGGKLGLRDGTRAFHSAANCSCYSLIAKNSNRGCLMEEAVDEQDRCGG